MRVERDRIGPRDAPHGFPPSLREHEEAAIGSVDVQPQPFFDGHIGRAVQIVDGPGVRCARACHKQERPESAFSVFADELPQVPETYLVVLVRGDLTNVLFRETGQHRRLRNGVMGLVRRVDRARQEVVRKTLPSCGDQSREGRQGAPARQDAGGVGRIANDLTEPPNHIHLELGESRRCDPHADVSIHGVCDEIGQCGREDSTPRDVRQITRCSRIERERDGLVEQEVHQFVEVCTSRREGLGECRHPCGGVSRVCVIRSRLMRQRSDVIDHSLRGLFDHLPHLVR